MTVINKKKSTKKRRKLTIAFLLVLSFIMTTGTFAYWATEVEGAKGEITGTLSLGSGDKVQTAFEVTNQLNTGGNLVPAGQLLNSDDDAVESIDISFDIKWVEDESVSQLEGTKTMGDIVVEHEVVLYYEGEILDAKKYKKIYALVEVVYNENNQTELELDASAETFSFKITVDEPNKKKDYDILKDVQIQVTFTYEIDEDTIITIDID